MDAKSKRDLIWEEKKRQREERMLRLEGMINDVEQRPISIPTQPKYEFEYIEQRPPRQATPPQQFQEKYLPPQPPQQFQERIQPNLPPQQMQPPPQMDPVKKQQQEYRDFLKQQMEQKEQEKRNRKSSAVRDQNDGQNYNQGNTPIVNHKQEYADALRQQMRENQEIKQRDRISSGLQQQNDPSLMQKKQQKQEYGDYLRMQMQNKNQKPIDKKEELQRKFEQQDAFIINNRVGPGAGPSKQLVQDQYIQQQPQYNQPSQYNQPTQYNQPQQYNQPSQYNNQPSQYNQPIQQQQQYQQQPQQYQNQFQQQQNQFQMPQQNQFAQQQQNQFSQQNQFMQQNQYYKEPQLVPNQQFYQQPQEYEPMMVQESAPQPEPQLRVGRNRLAMENVNLDDVQKKEKQKLEMQRVLQEQIEEKKRKKEYEKQQKELEDRLEEERLKREKQLMEDEKKREDEQKKQKQGAIIQDNVDLKEQRRLQRLQERKNRNNPQDNQQNIEPQIQLPIQEFNVVPPSQPASDHFLRDYMNNEKIKEGLNPDQSIIDFYKNGKRQQEVPQSNREIEEIKRQMVQNQEQLQQQLQNFMQQAQQAIESRNRAENELIQLKNQVKNKYIQEEKHHEDLMVALVKNDPKWEKQVFPPHLLAQAEIAEYRNLAMPEIKEYNLPPQVLKNQYQPVYESKPLVFKDQPQKQKQEFREEFGLQSLVSDSNMVPIDHYNGSIMQQRLPQIDELENHNEETQKYEHKPIQTWNMASVDDDIVKEIDQLLNYKPQRPPSPQKQQYQLKNPINQRPPSNDNRQLPSSTNRPASTTLNRAGLGVLGGDYRPITLDQDFPDLTMQRRDTNQDTLDIGAINRRNDQKLLQLNDYSENDDDIRKLDSLLHKYNF